MGKISPHVIVVLKTLERPLDCKEINKSILKEITPEHPLRGLMLKLKLQYVCHLASGNILLLASYPAPWHLSLYAAI